MRDIVGVDRKPVLETMLTHTTNSITFLLNYSYRIEAKVFALK
jgi:hypothetical protein